MRSISGFCRLLSRGRAIAQCNRLGVPIVLVTNQSGIAHRFYDWQGFHAVQAALSAALASAGAHLDGVFACAYHADGSAPFNIADHSWRKPNPGMIVAAGKRMKLDLSRSWIVGDRSSDIAAGRGAHLEGGILISPSQDDPERNTAAGLKAVQFVVETLPRSRMLWRFYSRRGALRRSMPPKAIDLFRDSACGPHVENAHCASGARPPPLVRSKSGTARCKASSVAARSFAAIVCPSSCKKSCTSLREA